MNDNDDTRYRWQRTLFIVLLLLVAYPLSAGPVCWAIFKAMESGLVDEDTAGVLANAYLQPLNILPDSMNKRLGAYLDWWVN